MTEDIERRIAEIKDQDLRSWFWHVEVFLSQTREARLAQLRKWGYQSHDIHKWLSILTEEVGELAKSSLENKGTASDQEQIETEAIQVAAVALAIAQYQRKGRA